MAQSIGLPVSRFINVEVALSPVPLPAANFDTCLVLGDSNVININERIRSYNSIQGVAGDFLNTTPEYAAAALFFSQNPQPSQLYIGRWASSATSAQLIGGVLTSAEQALSNWTSIVNGGFDVTIDGIPHAIVGLNFSAVSNLNGVASVITTALAGTGAMTWTGSQFELTNSSHGANSAISYLTPPLPPVIDISSLLQMTVTEAAVLVDGIGAETPLTAVQILDQQTTYWFFLSFATTTLISNPQYLEVCAYIEAAANRHVLGITTNQSAAISHPDTTSIGALARAAGYERTACQYSSTNSYALTSLWGRACTVNFNGVNTTITLMWKQEPGVTPEFLGSSEADSLDGNNYTYLAEISVGQAITVNGKTAAGFYIDEVWGTDWFANAIQTALFNQLAAAPKIPQTDPGVNLLVVTVEATCAQAVTNGLLFAGGVWTGPSFGGLNTGDTLTKGYFVFAPPVALQSAADRAARRSPLIQVAAKLAGAVHTVDVLVSVAR